MGKGAHVRLIGLRGRLSHVCNRFSFNNRVDLGEARTPASNSRLDLITRYGHDKKKNRCDEGAGAGCKPESGVGVIPNERGTTASRRLSPRAACLPSSRGATWRRGQGAFGEAAVGGTR